MIYDYVPMLIVAVNKEKEYIHIRKAENGKLYSCPCCGANIKARAMESEKVQPHFYHSEGSECSKENIAHWIYKNWLFDKGSKFIINKDGKTTEYKIDVIDIEKSVETKFGLYKPDITVVTSCGKTLFFEINYSNKKAVDDYFCKWDELKNDVVEVNIRNLINADMNNSTPEFDVIYSDGDYLSKYKNNSIKDVYRNTIKVYKEAIAKSDCENCKKRFEQLDWFWIMLQKYRLMKVSEREIIELFSQLEYSDMDLCYSLTKRLKCQNLQSAFLELLNNKFYLELDIIKNKEISNHIMNKKIDITQMSTQKYIIRVSIKTPYKSYTNTIDMRIYRDYFKYNDFTKIEEFFRNSINLGLQESIYFSDTTKECKMIISKIENIKIKFDYNKGLIKLYSNSINRTLFDYIGYTYFSSDMENDIKAKINTYNDQIIKQQKYYYLINNSCLNKHISNLINLIEMQNEDFLIRFTNNSSCDPTDKERYNIKYSAKLILYFEDQSIELIDFLNKDINKIYDELIFYQYLSEICFRKIDRFKKQFTPINSNIKCVCADIENSISNSKTKIWRYNSEMLSSLHLRIRISFNKDNLLYNKHLNNHRYIDIKNNILNDIIDLTTLSNPEIMEEIKNCIVKQMNDVLINYEKIGIYFRYQKEELDEKTTAILHNEISSR